MNPNRYRTKYGRVSSVFFDDEKRDIFVNVVTGPNREPREMKFSSPKAGIWYVPSEGDMVEVHNVNGTRTARYPAGSPEDFSFPEDLTEGDVCFQLNQDTQLHFSVQEDGTVNVDLTADGEISVDAPNVSVTGENSTVTATGDITVSAPNGTVDVLSPTVRIGDENGTFKPVARKGDPITGTGYNGASVSGQIEDGSSSVHSS